MKAGGDSSPRWLARRATVAAKSSSPARALPRMSAGGARLEDRLRDEVRLLVLVPAAIDRGRLAGGVLGPECLVFSLQVVVDHGGGECENALGRPVILLELHHARARKVLFKIQNVVDIRATPFIDRLVAIAHDAHVAMLVGQRPDDPVLRAVGVLV